MSTTDPEVLATPLAEVSTVGDLVRLLRSAPDEPPPLLSFREAARRYPLSVRSLRRRRDEGLIRWAKPGREVLLRRDDIEALLRTRAS